MKRFLLRRQLQFAALVVVGAAAGVVFVARNVATTQEPTGVVDFTKITPIGFTLPTGTAIAAPDFSTLPTCQAPANERPDPKLPPLSCRHSGGEPPPGSISTPEPSQLPDRASLEAAAPKGWAVIDNRLFRYTLAIPSDWYSNMRPEGGEFRAYDTVATREYAAKAFDEPGGVSVEFSATVYVSPPPQVQFHGVVDRHLTAPNASFGSYRGAIWDDGALEDLAHSLRAAFIRDGVLYEFRANIEVGTTPDFTDRDLKTAEQIIGSVSPY